MSRPGALTAATNYYRAMIRGNLARRKSLAKEIEAPTLVIWGEKDRYLTRELAHPKPEFVPNARVEYLSRASHWVQQDSPEEVNRLLAEFLGQPAEPTA